MFPSDLSLSRPVHDNQLRAGTSLGIMKTLQEERSNLALNGTFKISEKLFEMSTQFVGRLYSFLFLN
jgi:hypothetical protein